ncbi:MAG TPA: MBL fold metallo-hydrolase [Candidatus Dormibacteraeota bacterium]|nr:MBL fold metallo-hydrolase [Candidatus Dormibacteraeota bacterium]
MTFQEIRAGGCCSYLLVCDATCSGVLVDPELSQLDRILALLSQSGTRLHYLVDTHTHADHFSGTHELGRRLGVPVVMHSASVAPYVDVRVDDGETLIAGQLRLRVLHTPGHTADSISLVVADRVLTGDTLLRLATGRTDLPTGSAEELYDSLFAKLLRLDDNVGVFPGHNYKDLPVTSIGQERAQNPRLQKAEKSAFVDQMHGLNLGMPDHLTEALRTNRTGGKTVAQLLDEATRTIAFMSMEEVLARSAVGAADLVVLDVREREAFDAGHIPGARHVPRGQLEIRIDAVLPDPSARVVTCCEFGKISTLAAATLRTMGFNRAVALDGGMKAWREAGYPTEATPPPPPA